MIFQIFATVMLACVALYVFSQARLASKLSMLVLPVIAAGEFLVLFPDEATVIAHHVGIGRGADLIMYVWILLSLAVALYLHLKLRSANDRLTALVRELALREAERDGSPPPR